jgi:hypothetical protein
MLEKLKHDVTSSMALIKDPTKLLVAKIYITETMQHVQQQERFVEKFGYIRIEDNGHRVVQA